MTRLELSRVERWRESERERERKRNKERKKEIKMIKYAITNQKKIKNIKKLHSKPKIKKMKTKQSKTKQNKKKISY